MKRAECPAHVRLSQEIVRVLQAHPSYGPAARRIRAAFRRNLPGAADEAERRLMRCETAGMLFHAAIDRGAAFRTVERLFREALSLQGGYLPWEALAYAAFAEFCGWRGRAQAGIGLLEKLLGRLRHVKSRAQKRMLGYYRGQVREVLRHLRAGQLA